MILRANQVKSEKNNMLRSIQCFIFQIGRPADRSGKRLLFLEKSVKGLFTQCCVSGSGIRCLFTFGSGIPIRSRFIPDPGSRIPDSKPIFVRAF
jgi:hypothetical protein